MKTLSTIFSWILTQPELPQQEKKQLLSLLQQRDNPENKRKVLQAFYHALVRIKAQRAESLHQKQSLHQYLTQSIQNLPNTRKRVLKKALEAITQYQQILRNIHASYQKAQNAQEEATLQAQDQHTVKALKAKILENM